MAMSGALVLIASRHDHPAALSEVRRATSESAALRQDLLVRLQEAGEGDRWHHMASSEARGTTSE